MPGTVEMAEQIFDMPAKLDIPRGFDGLTDMANSPIHATGIGLIQYGVKHGDEVAPKSRARGFMRKIEKWFNEHF